MLFTEQFFIQRFDKTQDMRKIITYNFVKNIKLFMRNRTFGRGAF